MRYFLISLALNIAILFIPLSSDEIPPKNAEEKPQIKLVLNLQKEIKKEIKEDQIINPDPQIAPMEPEPFKEPEISPEPEIEKPKADTKKSKKPKEVKKPKPKKEAKKPEKQVIEPIATKPEPTPMQQTAPLAQTDIKEAVADKESFCKENVGFKVLKEPRADYPKKALMLRLKESFYVEVDFKVINSQIKVVAVRGKNKIFNDEAVRLTQDMQIKVLKELSHCIITKPYEFKLKD